MGFLLQRVSVQFLFLFLLVTILVLLQLTRSLDQDLQNLLLAKLSNDSLPIWTPQHEEEKQSDNLSYNVIGEHRHDDIEQKQQQQQQQHLVEEKGADTSTRAAHDVFDNLVPKEKKNRITKTAPTAATTNPVQLQTPSINFPVNGTKTHRVPYDESSSPSIQVFVVTAAGKSAYRKRYLANHNEADGWHHDFPTLQSYTFDELSSNDTLFDVVHSIPRFPQELKQNAASKNWNLLLASFGAIYKCNPNASWYFMAEDDTVVVKFNLERYVQMRTKQLIEDKEKMGGEDDYNSLVYEGKCVRIKLNNEPFIFVMGGPGILVSQSVLRRLAPYIDGCRKRYATSGHGDTRIAKCMKQHNITMRSVCAKDPRWFRFDSASAWWEMDRPRFFHDTLVVSMHEKDPAKLRFLNSMIRNLTTVSSTSSSNAINTKFNKAVDINYASMRPYLEQYRNENTGRQLALSMDKGTTQAGNLSLPVKHIAAAGDAAPGDANFRFDFVHTSITNHSTNLTEKSTSNESSSSLLQVFVVTAAGKAAYRERYLANRNDIDGWHHDFPTLQSYTFDKLLSNDTLLSSGVLHSVRKMQWEMGTNPRRNWNLLLASFEAIYRYNPNASWYFMAEDDTVVVKSNLEHYVRMRTMQTRRKLMDFPLNMGHDDDKDDDKDYANDDDYSDLHMEGKCVSVKKFVFVMGGSGILMSRGLLQKLAPHVAECRQKFVRGGYGDMRIAKCLDHHNLTRRIKSMCSRRPRAYRFSSASAWWEMNREFPNARVVSMHEKDPSKLRFLNSIIHNLTSMSTKVTYTTMTPYLKQYYT